MSDKVLIPLPDGRWLSMSQKAFEEALQAGAELLPQQTSPESGTPDEIFTADELAAITKVPASWFREAGKRGEIDVVRFKKYVRYPASVLSGTDTRSVAENGSKPGVARLSAAHGRLEEAK